MRHSKIRFQRLVLAFHEHYTSVNDPENIKLHILQNSESPINLMNVFELYLGGIKILL